jgi:hypothetical protein
LIARDKRFRAAPPHVSCGTSNWRVKKRVLK